MSARRPKRWDVPWWLEWDEGPWEGLDYHDESDYGDSEDVGPGVYVVVKIDGGRVSAPLCAFTELFRAAEYVRELPQVEGVRYEIERLRLGAWWPAPGYGRRY
jgi:hypothetical protein